MKSDLQLMILPEAITEGYDHTNPTQDQVLCCYSFQRRWHQHSILEVIVASAWNNDRRWRYDVMLARPSLCSIDGVPC